MASTAIVPRLHIDERGSGVPVYRPTAGDCYVSGHRIEVFLKAKMQRAFTIILRVTKGPLPSRI